MKPKALILVIDDEPTNFDVIETLLMAENYQLYYASSGLEALNLLENFAPDVILLDVMMPELDGIEVCHQIRANSKYQCIPILIVTALTSKADLARAIAAGADDFMSKPINSLELKSRVHSMLRIKRQHDQLANSLKHQENTITLLGNSLQTLRGNVLRALPHELNTPLHGMLGLVDLLIDSYPSMSAEDVQDALHHCKSSALRMDRLIQKFLSYVQLQLIASDPNRMMIEQQAQYATDAKYVIEAIAIAEATEKNRTDDLHLQIAPALVNLSESNLKLMVVELIDNAFKFSKAGTSVQVIGYAEPDHVWLTISNQGRCLVAEQISQIGSLMQFDRQQYEQQGIGLGLAIVQAILEIYDGTLSIQSHPDTGTVLTIQLPVCTNSSLEHVLTDTRPDQHN
jgi:two-component system, sensor histidine kinase and response regulator